MAAVLLGAAVQGHAFDSLDNLRARVYASLVTVEGEQIYVVLRRRASGDLERTMGRSVTTVRADGSFVTESAHGGGYSRDEFLGTGELVSSLQEDRNGRRTYSVQVTPDRRRVTFRNLEDGKEVVKRTTGLKPIHMLNAEMKYLISQAWTSGVRDGLSVKGFAPDGAREADMDIRLTESREPLSMSDRYDYPAELRSLFSPSEQYVVGDMYLTGIASLFYGHHNLMAFRKTPAGLVFVAYWGGDPDTAVYQFVPR
jgi:hypothetical protein